MKTAKNGRFAYVLAYKSPKTPFFAQKYLTRYTHETFFEEYTNFEAHYLSHCRVMSLQSFGSHIRPQPHGLGLTCTEGIFFFYIGHTHMLHVIIFRACMNLLQKKEKTPFLEWRLFVHGSEVFSCVTPKA